MILGVAGENDEILLQVWRFDPAIKTRAQLKILIYQ